MIDTKPFPAPARSGLAQAQPTLLERAWTLMMARDPDRAAERNAVGFNQPDSLWAHRVDRYPFAKWRDDMVDELVARLPKYRRQLDAAGIDVDTLLAEHRSGRYYRAARSRVAPAPVRREIVTATTRGWCQKCRGTFVIGDPIGFFGRDRYHERCYWEMKAAAEAPTEAPAPAPVVRRAPPPPSVPPDGDDAEASEAFLRRISLLSPARPSPVSVQNPPVAPRNDVPAPTTPTPIPTSEAEVSGDGQTAVGIVLGPGGTIAKSLPGYESRPAQLQMAHVIERAIAGSRRANFETGEGPIYAHVVAEAGTGTGKSLAYLVPAILSGQKVVVSTAVKALQDQLIKKDLPFLQEHMGVPFTYMLLKGRSNYVCKEFLGKSRQRVAKDEAVFDHQEDYTLLEQLEEWLRTDEAEVSDGDLEASGVRLTPGLREAVTSDSESCLGKTCPLYRECFVERAKAKSRMAQVVVVNHSLLLIDAKLREQGINLIPEADTLVVDEAHRLTDVARDVLGEEVTETRLGRLISRLQKLTVKHPETMIGEHAEDYRNEAESWVREAGDILVPYNEIFHVLKERLEEADESQQVLGDEQELCAPAITQLERFAYRMRGRAAVDDAASAAPKWLTGPDREAWAKLEAGFEKLARALTIVSTPEDADKWCRYAEAEGPRDRRRLTIQCKPIEVAEEMERMLNRAFPTVVFTSATLATGSDFTTFVEENGLTSDDFHVTTMVAPSPFPYERNALLYCPSTMPDPRVGLNEAAKRAYYDELARQIGDLLRISMGRAFCLFTSRSAMRETWARLSPILPTNWRLYNQDEHPRSVVVEAFKDKALVRSHPAVLFATRTFFEGVDIAGEHLELVILDKIPFPTAGDPLYKARCRAIDRKYGEGKSFERLTLPEAVKTAKQATGRLIRTNTDIGVCAILDVRLAKKSYGRTIVQALPPMRRTQNLHEVRALYARERSAV